MTQIKVLGQNCKRATNHSNPIRFQSAKPVADFVRQNHVGANKGKWVVCC